MTLTFTTHSADQTISLGTKIGQKLTPGDVIAMTGTLAAGKTTITKGIAKALGVTETITSPTFCLISEYEGTMPLYHMDVYRLDGAEDFVNLGVDDMLYGNGVCIIEWSEKIQSEIPSKAIRLDIQAKSADERTITISNWNHGDIQA
ncbi:MAG TPA: tRNA (adenosine(37)-N6)-threonylcarbamoyltransferase complex ATPase subunit type 1 TsaE [Treponema sp.]|nr:tRNA (adenosine(37)-N6)-threonylcarbamoyltransferase complex ATPase subunit type 1 TsaE [Treponema sp.]HBD67680.1 tRNA (adenosine(37)-N6)-threonylcarbamoyltransferase complex ATPase subunit type 1 TsaE [Treponema sp.]